LTSHKSFSCKPTPWLNGTKAPSSHDVSDQEIARVKRSIDRFNQQRNDWIEKLDDQIADLLASNDVSPSSEAQLNTETPGSAIDRLSIMALRLYHLREQLDRDDVDQQHRESVGQKINVCLLQQSELAKSLQQLINDLFAGKKRHLTYRQFKMYNDPTHQPNGKCLPDQAVQLG